MDKQFKIKRYKNTRIYNPLRSKIIKASAIIIGLAVLFTIGWFAYEPIMKAVNDANKVIAEENKKPEEEPIPVPEPVPVEFTEKDTKAVTVPLEKFLNAADYYDFLKALDDDVTAVVLDMKTADGVVTYRSEQVSVTNSGSISEDAVSLEARIKTARSLGLDVIARIYAFEDHVAPYSSYDMAIRYQSAEGVLWLDESFDNGGKAWLNPYSDTAQKYILDIVCDAIDYGVDAVLLDGVRFPGDFGMNYAYFGASAEGVSKGEVLSAFMQRVYATAVTSETDIISAYDAQAVLLSEEDIYGGSPAVFQADAIAPVIDLNAYIGERFGDGAYYRVLPEDVTELSAAVYNALGYGTDIRKIPVITCAGLTKLQAAQLFSVFKENGSVGCVMIYDEAHFTGAIPNEEESSESESSVYVSPVTPSTSTPPSTSSSSVPSSASSTPSSSSSSSVPEPETSPSSSSSSGSSSVPYSYESIASRVQ